METASVNITLPSFVIGPVKPANREVIKGVSKRTMLYLEKQGLLEIDDIRYSQGELLERNVDLKFSDGTHTRGLEHKGRIFFHKYMSGSFYPFLFEVKEWGKA